MDWTESVDINYEKALKYVDSLSNFLDIRSHGWQYIFKLLSGEQINRIELTNKIQWSVEKVLNDPRLNSDETSFTGLLLMLHVAERKKWLNDIGYVAINEVLQQLQRCNWFTLHSISIYPSPEFLMSAYLFEPTRKKAEDMLRRLSSEPRGSLYLYFGFMMLGQSIKGLVKEIEKYRAAYEELIQTDIEYSALALALCGHLLANEQLEKMERSIIEQIMHISYEYVKRWLEDHIVFPTISTQALKKVYQNQIYGYITPFISPEDVGFPITNAYIIFPHLIYKVLIALRVAGLDKVIVMSIRHKEDLQKCNKYLQAGYIAVSKTKIFVLEFLCLGSTSALIVIVFQISLVTLMGMVVTFILEFALGQFFESKRKKIIELFKHVKEQLQRKRSELGDSNEQH